MQLPHVVCACCTCPTRSLPCTVSRMLHWIATEQVARCGLVVSQRRTMGMSCSPTAIGKASPMRGVGSPASVVGAVPWPARLVPCSVHTECQPAASLHGQIRPAAHLVLHTTRLDVLHSMPATSSASKLRVEMPTVVLMLLLRPPRHWLRVALLLGLCTADLSWVQAADLGPGPAGAQDWLHLALTQREPCWTYAVR